MNIKNSFKNQIIALSLFSALALSVSSCKKDHLKETTLDAQGIKSEDLLAATSAPSNAYNIANALPSGYVKDGSRDYTTYIQAAIDKNSEIVFPGFPILVNDNGLRIGSNKRITFLNGSEIRLKPTANSKYAIIDIRGSTNVTLVDPVVVGDKTKHLSSSGEHGMGISISGSSAITLTNPRISNCFGDGIYIGIHDYKGCKDIQITNGRTTNNRRNGMSVVSVDGLKIDKFYSAFNSGVPPQSGIDFEPNSPANDLKNIVVNDLLTEANTSYGVQMTFKHLFGGGNKYVDITLNNHVDKQSLKPIKMSAYNDRRAGSEIVSIKVVYNNPSWRQHPLTPRDIVQVAIFEKAQHLTLKNLAVQSSSGTNLSASTVSTMMARLINTNYVTLTTVSSPVLYTVTEPVIEPITDAITQPVSGVVYAVNAGGSEFTASNGIKYLSDRNYSGGRTSKILNSISNTSDDALYQSERYGNFTYAVPVSTGTYQVTLKLAEVYHSAVGKRKFDVRLEGVEQVSNLDIYAAKGKNNAYDIVKTVSVTDGTLNLVFNTDIDNAKISAFHVIKK